MQIVLNPTGASFQLRHPVFKASSLAILAPSELLHVSLLHPSFYILPFVDGVCLGLADEGTLAHGLVYFLFHHDTYGREEGIEGKHLVSELDLYCLAHDYILFLLLLLDTSYRDNPLFAVYLGFEFSAVDGTEVSAATFHRKHSLDREVDGLAKSQLPNLRSEW